MADPTTPTTPTPATPDLNTDQITTYTRALEHMGFTVQQTTSRLAAMDEQTNTSNTVLNALTGGLAQGRQAFSDLGTQISQSMKDISDASDLTTSQMSKLSAAITLAIGAGDSFKNMRFDNLNTFSGQISGLVDQVKNNDTALGMLANSLGIIFPKSIVGAADKMAGFIKNMAMSADSSIKLEDVYIRAAAATGALGNVHEQAGTDLENMNAMVRQQRASINETIIATNLSKDTVESYYSELIKLPVAMKDGVTASDGARGATDALAKTIQLARGTGRDYKDILEDMHVAIRDYNASIPEAMKFTAQISEISQKYNVELGDVQKSLRETAESFKMFGADASGASEILNQYVGSLKATGLSGAVATDIVGNMTRQIGQLSIAQKAFLSGQQGGPGGLQGAFQVDMLLRQQGGMAKVMDMVKNQMTRMMGPLVTTEEAAASPAAAARMTRQIMMLQQGPLGQFARSTPEAERIIEALRKGRVEDVKAMSLDPVKEAADLGNKYAEQTATGISRLVSLTEAAKGVAGGAAVNLFQGAATARAGANLGDENLEAVQNMRAGLRGTMATGAERVGQPASEYHLITDFKEFMKDLPDTLRATVQGLSNLTGPEGAKEREEKASEMYAEFQARREAARNVPAAARTDELKQINKEEAAFSAVMNMPMGTGNAASPGQQVAGAANTVATRQGVGTTATGSPLGTPMHPQGFKQTETAPPSFGEVTVHVEGFCINCGTKMKNEAQGRATTVVPNQ